MITQLRSCGRRGPLLEEFCSSNDPVLSPHSTRLGSVFLSFTKSTVFPPWSILSQ